MLPIRDDIRSRSFPLVNWLLIGINAVVFFLEIGLPPAQMERLIGIFGLIPSRFQLLNPFSYLPVFTSIFLHGSWFHMLSNMWTLVIFGDNVEDRLGSGRYLLFYLLGGLAAGLMQVFIDPASQIPVIGASGAIAAVMGAYFFFYPRARVITLVPVALFSWFVRIPAIVYLGFWFVSQLYSGLTSLTMTGGVAVGGVAWWAHIGGFLFGVLAARPFSSKKREARWHRDEYYPW